MSTIFVVVRTFFSMSLACGTFVLRSRAICLLTLLAVSCSGSASAATLKTMTFNVKGDNATLFDNTNADRSWYYVQINPGPPLSVQTGPHRSDRAIAVIDSYSPDLLSVQELTNRQMDDLLTAFPQFSYFGQGRTGGDTGDRNGFFYRTDRFTLNSHGDFWLSATPETPGTTFQGNGSDTGNPRMATWGVLTDLQTGLDYFVLSTHWSLDSLARQQSAELIQARIAELSGGLPVLLMGDLNASQSSTPARTLRGEIGPGSMLLEDSFRVAGGVDGRTFHNWNGGVSGSRIDHVFHAGDIFQPLEAQIIRTTYDGGRYPSDHYPVTVTFLVPEPGTFLLAGCGLLAMLLLIRRS